MRKTNDKLLPFKKWAIILCYVHLLNKYPLTESDKIS